MTKEAEDFAARLATLRSRIAKEGRSTDLKVLDKAIRQARAAASKCT